MTGLNVQISESIAPCSSPKDFSNLRDQHRIHYTQSQGMLIIPLWFSFNNFIKYARLYPSSFSIALYLTCQSFSTTLPSRYGRRWGVGFHSSRSIKTIQGKEGKKGGRNKLTNEREMINEMCMADMIAQFPWRLPWNKFFST